MYRCKVDMPTGFLKEMDHICAIRLRPQSQQQHFISLSQYIAIPKTSPPNHPAATAAKLGRGVRHSACFGSLLQGSRTDELLQVVLEKPFVDMPLPYNPVNLLYYHHLLNNTLVWCFTGVG